ncbi:hypothetical protein BN946_scf184796.g5 [Trametes cinnabarina]|uniref:Uncharacterized protein n=1 Tax=Pycnoporus cinnabarinus TaxID=5643 RepID=A0A060SRC7_PYCCI|nr:hypothetical protein BN946_scf184796.g5 [Trametes cinnabarina]
MDPVNHLFNSNPYHDYQNNPLYSLYNQQHHHPQPQQHQQHPQHPQHPHQQQNPSSTLTSTSILTRTSSTNSTLFPTSTSTSTSINTNTNTPTLSLTSIHMLLATPLRALRLQPPPYPTHRTCFYSIICPRQSRSLFQPLSSSSNPANRTPP